MCLLCLYFHIERPGKTMSHSLNVLEHKSEQPWQQSSLHMTKKVTSKLAVLQAGVALILSAVTTAHVCCEGFSRHTCMLSQVSRRLVPKKSTTIIGCCGKAVFFNAQSK